MLRNDKFILESYIEAIFQSISVSEENLAICGKLFLGGLRIRNQNI